MAMDAERTTVTAESKLGDILARYPSVGPIIFQSGRAFIARPGDLYAQYPGITVADYAGNNGLDVEALVRRLKAEAEAATVQPKPRATDDEAPSRRRVAPLLGYTSAYRDREDSGGGGRSVVSVQSAHGPE
jgi:hypothetical protein